MNIDMDFFQILMFASSILLSIQRIPQNYKIYKSKSARDISYISILITLIGIFGIIIYGIHMDLIEMWAPPILQVIQTFQTFFMKIHYDNCYVLEEPENDLYIREEIDRDITSHVTIGIRGTMSMEDNIDYAFKNN